ncbi:MAG: hypothetical protein K9M36_01645 [Candidatus Pacebacteria bacterium]|nr:hypothetical protein [Candidatus Paceibacterota bacterium]
MTNKIIASIFIGIGLVFVSAYTVSAQMATSTADVSIVQSAEIKPIGFFDKIKLFFTFNSEKKASLLQEFSGRSFGLATQEMEQGNIAEAESFLRESEEHLARATVAVSRIPDLAIRQQVLSRFSDISENRVSILQDVQLHAEDEEVKQAIDRAVEQQESMRTSVGARLQSTKELEQKVVAVRSGADTRINVSTTDTTLTGENTEICNANTAPWIKVLSPNGGEEYVAGEEIAVEWESCNFSSVVYILAHNNSTNQPVVQSFIPNGTVNDGSETFTLSPVLVPGNYWVIIDHELNQTSGPEGAPPNFIDSSDNSFTINASGSESETTIISQSLTQAQAEILAKQTWGNLFPEEGCVQECGSVSVTVDQNNDGQYIVTAIFAQLDDSVSQTKRVSIATYQNGTWTLGQPTVTQTCHRGNSDGTIGWTIGTCI